MINVSLQAAQVLRQALQESGVPPEAGLRICADGAAWTLHVDIPASEDRVIRYAGAVVLIVGPVMDEVRRDGVIDIAGNDLGLELVLRRAAESPQPVR